MQTEKADFTPLKSWMTEKSLVSIQTLMSATVPECLLATPDKSRVLAVSSPTFVSVFAKPLSRVLAP